MGDPRRGDRPTPAATSRCRYCGGALDPSARFCAVCKRYQPDAAGAPQPAPTVRPCRYCAELIPAGARRCYHCSLFQRGLGRLVPASAATISALSALASMVVLLLNTTASRPRARSETDLHVFDYDTGHLYAHVTNNGNRPSFAGRAWFKLARECDWMARKPAFCTRPGSKPPSDVLTLKASREDAVIVPGPTIAAFVRRGDFDKRKLPAPLKCGNFATAVTGFKLCLAFEVVEYQQSTPRCLVREIANLSDQNYLHFVTAAACKPPGGET